MRLNGKQIISGDDVYLINNEDMGCTLSSKILQQTDAIKELLSNVKWLYKYGGTGSGGGGVTQSTDFSIYATINGILVNGDLITLPQSGIYKLVIKINRPAGRTFLINYQFGSVRGRATLDISKNYTYEADINLQGNDTLTIDASDGEITSSVRSFIMTQAYTLSYFLVNDNRLEYEADYIFNTALDDRGVKLLTVYNINVEGQFNYELYIDENQITSGVLYNNNDEEHNIQSGELLLDCADYIQEIGPHKIEMRVQCTPLGSSSVTSSKVFNKEVVTESLFIRFYSAMGTIYREPMNGNTYDKFNPGRIKFSGQVLEGVNLERYYSINYKFDNGSWAYEDEEGEPIIGMSVKERTEFSISHYFDKPECADFSCENHSITIRVNNNPNQEFTYYFYINKNAASLDYYSSNFNIQSRSYRFGAVEGTELSEYRNQIAIELRNSNNPITINIPQSATTTTKHFHFALGFQYSNYNDPDAIIVLFEGNNGQRSIKISQKQLDCFQNIKDIYIPTTELLSTDINSEYHLLSLVGRCLKRDGNDVIFQYEMYIDGIFEAIYSDVLDSQFNIETIKIGGTSAHSASMNIDLIDLTYINLTGKDNKTAIFNEFDVVQYYYAYKNAKGFPLFSNEENETETALQLLNLKNVFKQEDTYGMLEYNGSIETISQMLDIPVIQFSTANTSDIDILAWLNYNDYEENQEIKEVETSVLYSSGRSGLLPVILESTQTFRIVPQGSSTLKNMAKNLELSISGLNKNEIVLFSPNFKTFEQAGEDAYKTFLPEKSFTLKADVVDSSHSNNLAVGRFVNDVTSKFNTGFTNTGYGRYIKNCLDGFPCIVFLSVTKLENGSNTTSTYYLGIYNFNLGRNSHSNLGYVNVLDIFSNATFKQAGPFVTVTVLNTTYEINKNFTVAEIQGNSTYFDFSQFNDKVLFLQSESSSNEAFMYGDIIPQKDDTLRWIHDFTQRTALAGGYLFESVLLKNLPIDPDSNYGYNKGYNGEVCKNYVPNYKYQFTKNASFLIVKDPNAPVLLDATIDDVLMYIIGSADNSILPYVDYNSLVEYYTTCMALGLVDSVQKNLNIKTWNSGQTFYIAFYDMDTSLGVNNNGDNISYFCFSDYWNQINTELDTNLVLQDNIVIYRDFFNDKLKEYKGYDTPSSYLFAVAKYAKLLEQQGEDLGNLNSPGDLWAKWRRSNGVLRNADYFINKYYIGDLSSVNEILWNMNYRSKYMRPNGGNYNDGYMESEVKQFKGRRLHSTRDWLNNRFHIMDAYMNLERANVPILKYDLNTDLWIDLVGLTEPLVNTQFLDSENSDIIILHDIFSDNKPKSYSGVTFNLDIRVTQLAPLIINGPNFIERYIYDAGSTYRLNTKANGVQQIMFGGSYNINYLSTINPFITDGTLYIKSPYLKQILGTDGNLNRLITLKTPSLEILSLTGPKYTTVLNLSNENDEYPNLKELDISNSKLSLTLNNNKLNKLTISGGDRNRSLNITNVEVPDNEFRFTNVSAKELVMIPCRLTNPVFNENHQIKKYNIQGTGEITIKDRVCEQIILNGYSKVTILNCYELENVELNGTNYTNVTITGCNKLTSISFKADSLSNLTTLNVSNNSKLNTLAFTSAIPSTIRNLNISKTIIAHFNILGPDNTSHNENYLDLTTFSNPNSSNLTIDCRENNALEYVLFKNDSTPIEIIPLFKNCKNLKRVYGNLSFVATAQSSSAFSGCSLFSVHGTDFTRYNGESIKDSCGKYIHPSESTRIWNNGYVRLTGNGVTNISFKKVNGANYTSMFANTNCTQFDVYYILYGLKDIQCNISAMFYDLCTNLFTWDASVDNSPHRKMFEHCNQVTNMSQLFHSSCNSNFRIFSPVYENGVMTQGGLFTPITKCTNIDQMFFGLHFYVDRHCFDLPSDSASFSLTSMQYFFGYLCGDVNSLAYASSMSNRVPNELNNNSSLNHYTQWGNLTGFFNHLTKLTKLSGFLYQTYLIDYNTVNNIKATNIDCSFISQIATGSINLDRMFVDKARVTAIKSSFYTTSSISEMISEFSGIEPAEIILSDYESNGTFKGFSSLQSIGYSSDSNLPTAAATFSFGGTIVKKVENGMIPYNILLPCKNTILDISGLFANLTNQIDDQKIPGLLLAGCSLLTRASYLFYNYKASVTLTPNGFADCPRIQQLDYIFAMPVGVHGKMSGCIPYRLFYHGETNGISRIQGFDLTNGTIVNDKYYVDGEEMGNVVIDNGKVYYESEETVDDLVVTTRTEIANVETVERNYPIYNKFIENLNHAFLHTLYSYYQALYSIETLESNPNYSSFTYVIKNNKILLNLDTEQYDISYQYDGNYNMLLNDTIWNTIHKDDNSNFGIDIDEYDNPNQYKDNLQYYGPNEINETSNFCTPPDLFRYCKTNCDITYIFAYSGRALTLRNYNGNTDDDKKDYGLTGRICPYLLRPLSTITSIKGMFINCKYLSCTYNSGGKYIIPSSFFTYATNISDLTLAFSGIRFIGDCSFVGVFVPLARNRLNLNRTFYACYYLPTNGTTITISNVFTSLIASITNMESCFSVNHNAQNLTNPSPTVGSKDSTWRESPSGTTINFDSVFNSNFDINADKYIFDGFRNDTENSKTRTVTFNGNTVSTNYNDNNFRKNAVNNGGYWINQ